MGFLNVLKRTILLRQADKARDKGEWNDAVYAFTKLIYLEGQSKWDVSHYYEFRGDVLLNDLQDDERALEDFQKAYELYPRNDRAIAKIGLIYSTDSDKKAEAYTAIYKALEINPNNSMAKKVLELLAE